MARKENAAAMITECQIFFEHRSLRPVFRLLSVVDNSVLDAELAGLGFAKVEPSLVMTRKLAPADERAPAVSIGTDEWMGAYGAISTDPNDPAHLKHRAILDRLPPDRLFLVLREEDIPVACGIGVMRGNIVSLLDILVCPEWRGRGLGLMVVNTILTWAAARSAEWAMLQVVENNTPARRLYVGAGFEPTYGYYYRV
ncbi:MAG: GNAT family N-acetyltransferase [Opitutaceae bacterium]|nr:GNAT family N-acetyltransferase [Opitutaceae bacterium]